MKTTYANWSVAKLTKERDKIDKAIEAKAVAKKSLIAKMRKMAADGGLDFAEVFGGDAQSAEPARKVRPASKYTAGKKRATRRSGDKRLGPAQQIYRNPDNHDETWSGRGRQPRWVVGHLNSGGQKEELRF